MSYHLKLNYVSRQLKNIILINELLIEKYSADFWSERPQIKLQLSTMSTFQNNTIVIANKNSGN